MNPSEQQPGTGARSFKAEKHSLPSLHHAYNARFAATFLFQRCGGILTRQFVIRHGIPMRMFADEMLKLAGLCSTFDRAY